MVNIRDSKQMKHLTVATVQDSAGMSFPSSKVDFYSPYYAFHSHIVSSIIDDSLVLKQLSYLTMAFLPPSFAAAVFGMNVTVINPGSSATLGHYLELVLPLTALTIWIVIALEINLKRVTVHRMSRSNRTEVVSDTQGQSKLIQYAVEKADGNEQATAIEGHDGGGKFYTDQVGNEKEGVEERYSYYQHGHKTRVVREDETETVWELNTWDRLRWPFILISIALDERQRQRGKARTGGAGSNTKPR